MSQLIRPPVLSEDRPYFRGFDPKMVPSPAYVVDRAAVAFNLQILRQIADRGGARILAALKAFSLPEVFDLFRAYLDGACASGIYEATLGRTEIAGAAAEHREGRGGREPFQIHTFAPAYTPEDLSRLHTLSDHISFNSLAQYHRLRRSLSHPGQSRHFGIRINPECSLGEHPIYDPCAPFSRLGITRQQLDTEMTEQRRNGSDPLEGISGLHFHTLCENDSVALEQTLAAVYQGFGDILEKPQIRWLNMGGGHHITKPEYDRDHLVALIRETRERYDLEVILEPGEAVAIHTGVLVSSVLDLPRNGMDLAILDTSATAHMPDTLEMPYRAEIWGARLPGTAPYTYRLGGQTCLAGDVIGDYSFQQPLQVGDRLVFDDMSHYTMVKTTTFNGIPLPSIVLWDSDTGQVQSIRKPDYSDFRNRLGGLAT